MNVAVIMVLFLSWFAEWVKGGGPVLSLVVTGERGGQAVQETGLPEGPVDLLE
jgi:hypothetical protein